MSSQPGSDDVNELSGDGDAVDVIEQTEIQVAEFDVVSDDSSPDADLTGRASWTPESIGGGDSEATP